jgi:hypothetical protein
VEVVYVKGTQMGSIFPINTTSHFIALCTPHERGKRRNFKKGGATNKFFHNFDPFVNMRTSAAIMYTKFTLHNDSTN